YPVFAEVQYDDEGVHQAVAGQGIVEIEAAHSYFEVRRTWFWIAAGVLVALWVGILLWRGLAARSRRAESRPWSSEAGSARSSARSSTWPRSAPRSCCSSRSFPPP